MFLLFVVQSQMWQYTTNSNFQSMTLVYFQQANIPNWKIGKKYYFSGFFCGEKNASL